MWLGVESLRLLFDAFWLPAGPPSGKAVLRGVLETWVRDFPGDELHVVVRDPLNTALEGVSLHRAAWPLHPLNNFWGLRKLARNVRAEAVLVQNFWGRTDAPSFTFVHDVLFLTNPEWFSWKERRYLSTIPCGMRRATGVFTSSLSERQRILSNVEGVRTVEAVGLAPASTLLGVEPVKPEGLEAETFLVCVGRLNQRKNLRRVIDGFERAQAADASVPPLLIVGPDDGLTSSQFPLAARSVRFLGSVTDGELRWLYENAKGLLFGSLDEGFGLPPLEALSFGCPIAVSDIPVMHEVVGNAAIYFDPRDPASIASAVGVLNSAPRRAPSRVFDWSSVVERLRGAIVAKI